MTLEEMRSRLDETIAEMRQIHEAIGENEPTDEQTARWEELTQSEQEQRAAIETAERRQRVDEARARFGGINVSTGEKGPFADDPRSLSRSDVRDRVKRMLDDQSISGHMAPCQRQRLDMVVSRSTRNTDGNQIGRMALLTGTPDYRAAFTKLIAGNPLTADEARAVNAVNEYRAASLTDAAGGYAVPTIIDPTVILTSQGSPNDILAMARVETITTDQWTGLSTAGVSWQFSAEAAATTDNTPTIAQPTVTPQRCDGFIPYSFEIGMDWPGFANEMMALLEEGYRELLASKLTNGTSGSSEPIGIVTRIDATTTSERELATAGTLAAADMYGLWDALPIRWRRAQNCAFMSSTDFQNDLRQLGTVDPNFSVNIGEEGILRLFGRPYPVNDYMNDMPSGTGVQLVCLVGDWQQFLIAQRAGMSVETVPMLFDVTNNRPTGQRGLFAWARIGSDAIVPGAFRALVNRSA